MRIRHPAAVVQKTLGVDLKPDDKPGAAGKPVKVFVLMGQSNMVGMGDIGPESARGTLTHLTRIDRK